MAEEARAKAAARAQEAVESHLIALILEPTRRRHVSMAAAMLAHASLANAAGGLQQWRSAVVAADVSDACDEDRPPAECYHVLLGHARSLMDLGRWGLAREAARLAVSARGEKTSRDKAASSVARRAEEMMDHAAADAALKRATGDGGRDFTMKQKPKASEL